MKKQLTIFGLAAMCSSLVSLSGCVNSLKQIGILQVITHDALGADRQGFIDQLEKEGFKDGENISIKLQIPEGDSPTETSMANSLALSSDLVFGIATSSSLALKKAVSDLGASTPVLYSAVTDPVAAGLITSSTDHGNVVGTSDAGPTAKNIDLFTQFSSIDKIGILYNTAEQNSIIQKNEAQAECDVKRITLIDGGVTAQNEIASSLNSMIAQGIKGLFIPTDNTVAAAMVSIKETVIANKIITICADAAATKNGGSLGYSVDYYTLGQTTGKMAAKILNGTDPSTIECSLSDSFPLELNSDFFTATGISVPAAIQAEAEAD